MRILIAEDDSTSRVLMEKLLAPFGDCEIALNGKEAQRLFRAGLETGDRYGLVCLDIMMPESDGLTALREIRRVEEERGIEPPDGTKIIMTTALDDSKSILGAFGDQCDGYLVKPIHRAKLLELLEQFGYL